MERKESYDKNSKDNKLHTKPKRRESVHTKENSDNEQKSVKHIIKDNEADSQHTPITRRPVRLGKRSSEEAFGPSGDDITDVAKCLREMGDRLNQAMAHNDYG